MPTAWLNISVKHAHLLLDLIPVDGEELIFRNPSSDTQSMVPCMYPDTCAHVFAHAEGDAFILAFHTPADALRYCLEVQLDLMMQPWPSQVGVT